MTQPAHPFVSTPAQPVAVRRALEFVQAVARSASDVGPTAERSLARQWRREAREIVAALAGEG